MTPELHALLLSWLDSGTSAQRTHAAYRLSLPDAIGYEVPAGYVALAPVVVRAPGPVVIPTAYRLGWKHCLYSTHAQNGCCGGALTCHWRREVIPLQTCVDCIGEMT